MTRITLFVAAAAAAALAGQALAAPPPATVQPAPPTTNPPQAGPGQPPSQPGDLHPNAAVTPGLAVGMAVKDNTGAAIGNVTAMKPDGTGRMFATITMGPDAFQVDASSLAVQEGSAVINMTQAEIVAMLKKPASPQGT